MSDRPEAPSTGSGRPPARPCAGASSTDVLLRQIRDELRALRSELQDDPPARTGGRVYLKEPAPVEDER